ncbi:bifunctional phosphoribosyl-AMP cyclohydrolase/phosphoribosyl-ATP diphosphatase HisIE [endosymbiont 'TC1' of Trimyema compressum]|uniref:bifunctional phosphoribosyl-AMP cyclohydrolase/phosphoribosyl-ATP diphosphatase HisIE n=1 Tax=endosymbiont 'TC1' of Trimyema compressum TaxID=243899 RepID=UPI000AA54342|nr:bifunctional phosphoribosyl-AMP cyclohydrolase/phosphoribosyl-ATP diphosphatase HisIE [endosymbiont 'TC1' of Trimyema compressum]
MLAYMSLESLVKTLEIGEAVYYSRSRQELWHKGETSGHFQKVKKIAYDCDKDTLLIKVKQIGCACHEGEKSCFHYDLNKYLNTKVDVNMGDEDRSDVLFGKRMGILAAVIEERYKNMPEGSYTTYLFEKGIDKILKKVGEEASEVIIASKNDGNYELIYEASDLLYHLMVLFKVKNVKLKDIEEELIKRS